MVGRDITAEISSVKGGHLPVNPLEILLVEDDEMSAQLMKTMLSRTNLPHQLHIAKDGETALTFLHRQNEYQDAPLPRLIMLDLNLPDMSGYDILTSIKNDPNLDAIPILVLTGSKDIMNIAQAYKFNANAYMAKPFTKVQLDKAINAALDPFLFVVVR